MAASGLKQGTRMASCIWGIAAILVFGAALFVVRACFGSLVFASYPGSFEFTGAPYYTALSALKIGADMAHIFCSKSAANPIKTYSP